jgi:predicted nucleotidyltransferase
MKRLDQLRSMRPAILELAAKHGMRRVRIFGSVARGEETEASDVDLLVDVEPGRSLLDLAGFELDLEDLLGGKVEVVTEGGISPYIEARVLQEAVPL